jgi:hypothetical protein
MEGFEEVALNQVAHKSICWFHYVEDSVTVRPQGLPWQGAVRALNQVSWPPDEEIL